jgi:tetratricopeptide (TPR) repeat protein
MKKKEEERKFTKCPLCGVSMNINNLAEHLWRVHNKSTGRGRVKASPQETGNGRIINITACDTALGKGAMLVASRRFKRAIKVLKTIPEEYNLIDNVYMLIGVSYVQMRRIEEAFPYFEKAVKLDPSYAPHWCNLGSAYLHKGHITKARECLNKALALNPDEEVKENSKEALREIEEFLRLELADKPGMNKKTVLELEERFHRGIECMDNEDWDAAIEEFTYVTRIDPTSEKAYSNLGTIYLLKGELGAAEKHLKKSLDIDPTYKPALINYRTLKKLKGEPGGAQGYLTKLRDTLRAGIFKRWT